jgi:hypothetical protein
MHDDVPRKREAEAPATRRNENGSGAHGALRTAATDDTTAEPKERLSFRLPVHLVEEIRGAIVQVGGPLRLTLDGLATEALRAAINRLRSEHNGGKPFAPQARGVLRPGRPVGA